MKKLVVVLFIGMGLILPGCGSDSEASGDGEKVVIGYFPNLNHAPAMVAKEKQLYEKQLGDDVKVEYKTFSDGSSFMTALATDEIHAGLVGPGPAMNHYISGFEVKAIAGASTGGTVIVSRKDSGVEAVEDIHDVTFISPRVGCTHDVQFETYMKEKGVTSDRIGGSLKHVTGKPAQYTSMFESGSVDVATAPEPWASVLEAEQDANVLIESDEISFGDKLPAAVFVTSDNMTENHPKLVQKLANAHKESIEMINDDQQEAIDLTINGIDEVTGQKLDRDVMKNAFKRTHFDYDIDQETIQAFGDSSYDLQFLKEQPDFTNFVDESFIK
ncbi:ABC transporter substrate-binding protein [Virgibacillus alimentarius]|uniref:NitT/TauT family transport system substrate-binding protein n=1 Tax=Virgibacillus alimentarius TaxID=698769 RepID=A0ABS4S9V5_9BACI|nr:MULTISPECIES: ABC transporter substrate-binding protein [Virgibacillus]MBP2258107.1 NitT/TauT family transport system substrate-binding protein [Virgibacillus alimentarius]HLR69148.1 ABC transporter substrate-binding protein [Virgibacillus sp.]